MLAVIGLPEQKKNGMKLMESKKMEKRKNTLDQKVIFEKIIFVP